MTGCSRAPGWSFVWIWLLCVFLIGCKKDPAIYGVTNLNGDRVLVFGHGGMGISNPLPMNSLAAFTACSDAGADGVEMDVRLTLDDELVLFHGSRLEESTACEGPVEEMFANSLRDCRYAGRKKEPICFLNEVVAELPPGLLFAFDCKTENADDTVRRRRFAGLLCDQIVQMNIGDRCLVESHDPEFLKIIKQRVPAASVYLYCDDYRIALDAAKTLALDGITIDMNKISRNEVEEMHTANMRVTVFNARTKAMNLGALKLSPDNIQSDNVHYLMEIYGSKRDPF